MGILDVVSIRNINICGAVPCRPMPCDVVQYSAVPYRRAGDFQCRHTFYHMQACCLLTVVLQLEACCTEPVVLEPEETIVGRGVISIRTGSWRHRHVNTVEESARRRRNVTAQITSGSFSKRVPHHSVHMSTVLLTLSGVDVDFYIIT